MVRTGLTLQSINQSINNLNQCLASWWKELYFTCTVGGVGSVFGFLLGFSLVTIVYTQNFCYYTKWYKYSDTLIAVTGFWIFTLPYHKYLHVPIICWRQSEYKWTLTLTQCLCHYSSMLTKPEENCFSIITQTNIETEKKKKL
jgi:hypothetical protein